MRTSFNVKRSSSITADQTKSVSYLPNGKAQELQNGYANRACAINCHGQSMKLDSCTPEEAYRVGRTRRPRSFFHNEYVTILLYEVTNHHMVISAPYNITIGNRSAIDVLLFDAEDGDLVGVSVRANVIGDCFNMGRSDPSGCRLYCTVRQQIASAARPTSELRRTGTT